MGSCLVGGCGYGVTVRDSTAYVHTFFEFLTVDLREPTQPAVLGRDSSYGQANDIVLIGDYAITGKHDGMYHEPELEVFDVADPTQPTCVLTVVPPAGNPLGLTAAGDLVLVALANGGLAAYRFTPPSSDAPRRPIRPAVALELAPNWPNPFNAVTTLSYALPQAGNVELAVLDLLGRKVATLYSGPQAAGRHELRWDAGDLPSGLYFARLTAGPATRTRKLLLTK